VQYRRFGTSELVVSQVGFGTWTLASDWWGHVEDQPGLLHAALDAGITFFDTAPVYGSDGVGETLLADLLRTHRDEIVLTTKCGYDIDAPRLHPGQSERPQDWRPEAIRAQLDASLRRLGTDYVDLYQLHNARLAPILDDDLWAELARIRESGKIREIGVALGPAIGWVEEGLESLRRRPIASLQTVFNVLEQEPGLTFAAELAVTEGRVGLISRVPHASDVLSGKSNRDNMLDNFDKAEALTFLWEGTGRTMAQAAIAAILAHPAFTTVLPTVVSADEVREFAAASDQSLTPDEKARVDELWTRNFDHTDRYTMPLKSSA